MTARTIAANAQLGAAVTELISIAQAIRSTLSTTREAPLQAPFNAHPTHEETLAAHRRAHRTGLPGKIESDPELEAFIAAHIDTMTYAQIVQAVKSHFPADRHTSTSAVQRWRQKRLAREGNLR